eukprot:3423116-Prymnesium_polylepis.1
MAVEASSSWRASWRVNADNKHSQKVRGAVGCSGTVVERSGTRRRLRRLRRLRRRQRGLARE